MDVIQEHGEWLDRQSSWIGGKWFVDSQDVYQELAIYLLAGKSRRSAKFLTIHKLACHKKRQMEQWAEGMEKVTHTQSTDIQAVAQQVLDPMAWQVLQLFVLEGLPFSEVAKRTGKTVDQVRWIHKKALFTLKEQLEKDNADE